MHRVGWKSFAVSIMALSAILSMMLLNACDNSANADENEPKTSLQSSIFSKSAYPDSFKPNDKEYPYANIPRIVIYTENQQKIKDRETEIPAKLQIWGKKDAETEVLDLTIRGRGNTSWTVMPKKSYKIEFEKKQSMLGMPKDRDWALIANYADKTLMRNYIAYRLSAALGAYYAPRCEFAELYLNGEYLGVYLLTETIKIGKNRVNIPKDDFSYIIEVDEKYRANEQVFFSNVLTSDGVGKSFRVHDPKNASKAVLDTAQNLIQRFEKFLKRIEKSKKNNIEIWIDVKECVKHYWINEFSKNPDSWFYTSVYFSWVKGENIKMGPVWDYDLAFGNYYLVPRANPNNSNLWNIRSSYWYDYLFRDSVFSETVKNVWNENHDLFSGVLDSIDRYQTVLKKAYKNEYKKWDVDESDDSFGNMKNWIKERISWIDKNL